MVTENACDWRRSDWQTLRREAQHRSRDAWFHSHSLDSRSDPSTESCSSCASVVFAADMRGPDPQCSTVHRTCRSPVGYGCPSRPAVGRAPRRSDGQNKMETNTVASTDVRTDLHQLRLKCEINETGRCKVRLRSGGLLSR